MKQSFTFTAFALLGLLGAASGPLQSQTPGKGGTKPEQPYVATAKEVSRGSQEGAETQKGHKPPEAGVISGQPPAGYHVGADDELMISVWHEPELSQAVVVRPDGMITLPLVGDVKVSGLATEEVQAALTEKLKALVNDPQITVSVKAVKSQRVFLMGAVGKQGVYPVSTGLTVLQLIAQGGGLGVFAKVHSIYILRRENGRELRIPVNYKRALSGKGDDPVLLSGDMVVVP